MVATVHDSSWHAQQCANPIPVSLTQSIATTALSRFRVRERGSFVANFRRHGYNVFAFRATFTVEMVGIPFHFSCCFRYERFLYHMSFVILLATSHTACACSTWCSVDVQNSMVAGSNVYRELAELHEQQAARRFYRPSVALYTLAPSGIHCRLPSRCLGSWTELKNERTHQHKMLRFFMAGTIRGSASPIRDAPHQLQTPNVSTSLYPNITGHTNSENDQILHVRTGCRSNEVLARLANSTRSDSKPRDPNPPSPMY